MGDIGAAAHGAEEAGPVEELPPESEAGFRDARGAAPTASEAAGASEGVEVLTICLIGPTGAGKSATGNTFFKQRSNDLFAVSVPTDSNPLASKTSRTATETLPWRGEGQLVRCVDSPGLGDSEGRDTEHMEEMVGVLKHTVKHVHVFLVLFNGQEPKMNIHLKNMLLNFKEMFGEDFLRNVMVGLTRWEYDRRSRRRRERSGDTSERRAATINSELRNVLGHDFDCPCVFLDNRLNMCSDEELEDDLETQLEEVLCEFEKELQKVYVFMRSREPFECCGIEVVLAEREEMQKRVRTAFQSDGAEQLGRRLVELALNRGELWWRRPPLPPVKVWGVLRRQQLRFYTDEREAEAAGPEGIELTGCICGTAGWRPLVGFCFTVYRPVQDATLAGAASGSARSGERHDFAASTEDECRRWTLLVQEATQISESWSRIQQLYERLTGARVEEEYVQSLAPFANETMVIPVEWVRHGSQTATQHPTVTLEQAKRDLGRDDVALDGRRTLVNPSVEEFGADVALRVIQTARRARPDDEAKALILAKDVVLACSRTNAGDVYDALRMVFNNEDLVHLVPDEAYNRAAEPVSVRVLRPDDPESVLHESAPGASTGLPQFEGDASASAISYHQVKRMSMDKGQELRVTPVDQSTWVPDWAMPQCMRCGVQFNVRIRRHHCRKCGALICSNCSKHFVPLAESSRRFEKVRVRGADLVEKVRVCFLCYQKAVIADLTARKASGCSAEDLLSEKPGSQEEATSEEAAAAAAGDDDDKWPVVSVEMGARYNVHSAEALTKDNPLFVLDCKYVRQVRWNGIVDAGRIVISIA